MEDPEDLVLIRSGERCRTNLEKAIQLVKTECYPRNLCKKTMRNWINHYIIHGETPTETRERNVKLGLHGCGRPQVFNDEDTRQLHAILESQPELYLDEIQTLLRLSLHKVFL